MTEKRTTIREGEDGGAWVTHADEPYVCAYNDDGYIENPPILVRDVVQWAVEHRPDIVYAAQAGEHKPRTVEIKSSLNDNKRGSRIWFNSGQTWSKQRLTEILLSGCLPAALLINGESQVWDRPSAPWIVPPGKGVEIEVVSLGGPAVAQFCFQPEGSC